MAGCNQGAVLRNIPVPINVTCIFANAEEAD